MHMMAEPCKYNVSNSQRLQTYHRIYWGLVSFGISVGNYQGLRRRCAPPEHPSWQPTPFF